MSDIFNALNMIGFGRPPMQVSQYPQMADAGGGNVIPLPIAGMPPVQQPAINSHDADRMRMEYMMRLWQAAPPLSPFIGRSFGRG